MRDKLTIVCLTEWPKLNDNTLRLSGIEQRYLQKQNKKAVLPQGNRAMLQVFFSVEVRQQHSLRV